MDKNRDNLAALGRLLIAAIFIWSGIDKLMSYEGTVGYISSVGLPAAPLGYAIAVVVEILGGLALIVGFKTRWAAAALAVYSLATAIAFHNQFSDLNQMVHFMKNISMIGGLLQVMAFGAGALSFDAKRKAALA